MSSYSRMLVSRSVVFILVLQKWVLHMSLEVIIMSICLIIIIIIIRLLRIKAAQNTLQNIKLFKQQ